MILDIATGLLFGCFVLFGVGIYLLVQARRVQKALDAALANAMPTLKVAATAIMEFNRNRDARGQ